MVSSGSSRSLSKLQTTPGRPTATYSRARSESSMTTSGTPGSGRLDRTSPLLRSRTTRAAGGVADVDRLERGVAVRRDHLGPIEHADVRPGGELVDEILRHALLERFA